MMKMCLCGVCYTQLFHQDEDLFNLLMHICEEYVKSGFRPLDFEFDLQLFIDFKRLEISRFIVSHQTNINHFIKPLGYTIGRRDKHIFCLGNHLEAYEEDLLDD